MTVIEFPKGACDKVRRYLDPYIDNELLVETSQEVLRHMETCTDCTAELKQRLELRDRLRGAARSGAPVGLEAKIRGELRQYESQKRRGRLPVPMWAAAAAILFIGVFTGWMLIRLLDPSLPTREAQDRIIHSLADRLASVLRIGLGDHVHCSVYRRYPKTAPTVAELKQKLDPQFAPLLEAVRGKVPDNYQVLLAHECGYQGRKFFHIGMRGEEGKLVSLVVANKRDGESFQKEKLLPLLRQGGIDLYQSGVDHYQVAGMETRDHLAFVVSDLSEARNMELMAKLAAPVRSFLVAREN